MNLLRRVVLTEFCFIAIHLLVQGGETLIADSRLVAADMDRDVIERLMYTNIRYLVGIHRYKVFAIPILNRVIRRLIALVSKRTLKELGAEMRYVDDGKELHIITKAQPPAIQHPDSKQTIWFNDMHGHSHYLTMKLNPQSGWLNQPTRDVQTGNYKIFEKMNMKKYMRLLAGTRLG